VAGQEWRGRSGLVCPSTRLPLYSSAPLLVCPSTRLPLYSSAPLLVCSSTRLLLYSSTRAPAARYMPRPSIPAASATPAASVQRRPPLPDAGGTQARVRRPRHASPGTQAQAHRSPRPRPSLHRIAAATAARNPHFAWHWRPADAVAARQTRGVCWWAEARQGRTRCGPPLGPLPVVSWRLLKGELSKGRPLGRC
jgi:hypothetical protein